MGRPADDTLKHPQKPPASTTASPSRSATAVINCPVSRANRANDANNCLPTPMIGAAQPPAAPIHPPLARSWWEQPAQGKFRERYGTSVFLIGEMVGRGRHGRAMGTVEGRIRMINKRRADQNNPPQPTLVLILKYPLSSFPPSLSRRHPSSDTFRMGRLGDGSKFVLFFALRVQSLILSKNLEELQ